VKRLLLMRHAKSSWADERFADHDRPLNERGRNSVPVMAALLAEQGLRPDLILSSTALRARDTAFAVAEAFEWSPEVRLSRRLYLAEPAAILARIAEVSAGIECLLVAGHNPGMEDLVSDLANQRERMPTAAIAKFTVDANDWTQLRSNGAELAHVWRAKELD
jgi:phosphohistidine phosphatase